MHGQEVVTITCTDRNRCRLKCDVYGSSAGAVRCIRCVANLQARGLNAVDACYCLPSNMYFL